MPYGTDPVNPTIFGYHTSNDVANPTNSAADVPFWYAQAAQAAAGAGPTR